MSGMHLSVDSLLIPGSTIPSCIYLDATCWNQYVDWLATDPSRLVRISRNGWNVALFADLLNRAYGSNTKRNSALQELGITLRSNKSRQQDEMYVAEVQRVYFDGEPNARLMAEFLALIRRDAGVNSRVTILSQNRAFRRIPLVDTITLPYALEGRIDLPAQFDFFVDFDVHPRVESAIKTHLANADYPTSIVEATKELFEYIRECSGLTSDGRNLAEQALKKDGSCIKLNALGTETEKNEQAGYRDFFTGVASALRNPIAHSPSSHEFITSRYHDKRKSLKVLSFLSLLFEKLDTRV